MSINTLSALLCIVLRKFQSHDIMLWLTFYNVQMKLCSTSPPPTPPPPRYPPLSWASRALSWTNRGL